MVMMRLLLRLQSACRPSQSMHDSAQSLGMLGLKQPPCLNLGLADYAGACTGQSKPFSEYLAKVVDGQLGPAQPTKEDLKVHRSLSRGACQTLLVAQQCSAV